MWYSDICNIEGCCCCVVIDVNMLFFTRYPIFPKFYFEKFIMLNIIL